MADERGASDLRGGCFCGAVRFEAREIFDSGYCHCSICRRFSGAPAVAWANLPARSFRITRGSPRGFASSERWVRYFCPACGCPVFGRHPHPPEDGSDLVCFSILSLDEPLPIRPSAHIWCSSRLPWFDTRDDLPRFADGELSPPDTRAGVSEAEPQAIRLKATKARLMSSDTRTFEFEGHRLGYPSFYRDGSSALGLFLVPIRPANALVAQSGFQVAELLPGRAAFTLTCVHYTDSDCGAYEEISLAFFVQPFGGPRRVPYLGTWRDIARSRAPSHTWRLPVTSTLARDAGIRMWGFPKTLEDIRFELSGGRADWALYDGGRPVLRYSVRAQGSRHQRPSPTPVYSLFEGAPHVSHLTQEFRDLGVRLGGGRLSLGEHPVADELRSLGLPRRPLLSAWMGRLGFEMSAPEKL